MQRPRGRGRPAVPEEQQEAEVAGARVKVEVMSEC